MEGKKKLGKVRLETVTHEKSKQNRSVDINCISEGGTFNNKKLNVPVVTKKKKQVMGTEEESDIITKRLSPGTSGVIVKTPGLLVSTKVLFYYRKIGKTINVN